MSALGGKFIHIREISPDAPLWVVRAQLIRLWTSPMCTDFSCVQSVEMVFIDQQEDKIQVSVSKELLRRKKLDIVEGGIDIVRTKHDTEFLVDKVGLLTSLSYLREYIGEDKDVAAIYMEITDPTGTVECVLYDEYVEDMLQFLHNNGPCTPVIVLQFARIVPDAQVLFGEVGIESVDNITRVLFNPGIPEVFQMLEWLHSSAISPDGKIQYQHLDMPCLSLLDEFFLYHPRRQVGELNQTEQVGVFVVCATITGLLENQPWWFSSYKPRSCSSKGPSLYSCDGSYSLIPRYNLKVEISDGHDTTYLSLGDADVHKLINISCKDLLSTLQVPHNNNPPQVFNSLIGKRMLFLVKKVSNSDLQEGCFKVKRVCADKELVRMFFKGHFFRSDHKPKATVARMLGELRNTHQFHRGHGRSHVGPMGYGGPSSSQGNMSVNKEGTHFDSNTGEQPLMDKHCVHLQQTNLEHGQ
ncbi:Nucleic acid-binding, OB-fold [Sesbania bispinosa]|nr:Nucleic acid-binding, OB-fold [Sesbania bispinosa]